MLLGMISPHQVAVISKDKSKPCNIDIWRDVGYIVETPYSYPELTVRELRNYHKLRN